jgi:predicted molibdopterin-dependent oxidoreductase YjgC
MAAATEKAQANGKKNGKANGALEVNTVCSFCGVGCGLTVKVKDGVIQGTQGDKGGLSNKGEACIKGLQGWRYMYSDRRLTKPLIRKDGELVEASWEEALDLIGSKMSEIRDEHGGDAFGVFSSSRSTNELNYLASKFARSVLGTNNIDSCNRA